MSRLQELLDKVRGYVMTPEERQEQRISWARGQYMLSNPGVSLEEADKLARNAAKETDQV